MEKDGISIRLATLADLDIFYDFFAKNIQEQFPECTPGTRKFFIEKDFTKESFQKSLLEDKKYIFLAFIGNQIIGFLTAQKVYGGISFCEWLAVDKDYQRHGIGSKLLDALSKFVYEKGGHKIHLWSAEKNLDFYKKNGFTVAGNIPDNYFGLDDYLLYKTLRRSEENLFLSK